MDTLLLTTPMARPHFWTWKQSKGLVINYRPGSLPPARWTRSCLPRPWLALTSGHGNKVRDWSLIIGPGHHHQHGGHAPVYNTNGSPSLLDMETSKGLVINYRPWSPPPARWTRSCLPRPWLALTSGHGNKVRDWSLIVGPGHHHQHGGHAPVYHAHGSPSLLDMETK